MHCMTWQALKFTLVVVVLADGALGPFGPFDLKSMLAMLKQRIDEVS